MKHINEYLSTKVKVATNNTFQEFPEKNAIIDFLEKNDFIYKRPNIELDSFDKYAYFSKQNNHKFYTIFNDKFSDSEKLLFGKGGYITSSNPIFVCYLNKDDSKNKFLKCFREDSYLYRKYEVFVKEVNEYFNFNF